jgi:hypothetical protein
MNNHTPQPGHGAPRDRSREKFWRKALRDFAVSGQSVREFCRARELSEPSFYSWRRTLAQRDAATPADAPGARVTPAFVPIRLAEGGGFASARGGFASARGGFASPAMIAPMEIVLAGGHRIRLHGPVDRAALAEVVATLEGQPSKVEGQPSTPELAP